MSNAISIPFTERELVDAIKGHYKEHVECLTREVKPGGGIVSEYDDDFDGHVVITEAEAEQGNAEVDAAERLSNLTKYSKEPTDENLEWVKRDVGAGVSGFTLKGLRRIMEDFDKNTEVHRRAARSLRLIATPEETWRKALGIVEMEWKDVIWRGYSLNERGPIEFMYFTSVIADGGDVSHLLKDLIGSTEAELKACDDFLVKDIGDIINLDYREHVISNLEKLRRGVLHNLLAYQSGSLIHVIHNEETDDYRFRLYEGAEKLYGAWSEVVGKKLEIFVNNFTKELFKLGFSVRVGKEELPPDKSHLVEQNHYEAYGLLDVPFY